MLAQLKDIIPGAQHWPRSCATVRTVRSPPGDAGDLDSPSLFLRGMTGSRIPVAVAHGEGRASFPYVGRAAAPVRACASSTTRPPTELYPLNPNGSPEGSPGSPPPMAA